MFRRHGLGIKSASFIMIGIATCALIGWVLAIPIMKSILPGLATMKVNTAIGFLGVGLGLWILSDENLSPRKQKLALLCSLVVLVVSSLSLAEYIFGWNLGIDELLFKDPDSLLHPGRMSQATAIAFCLLGMSLLLLVRSKQYWLIQSTALAVFFLALVTLIAYLFGVESLYKVFAFSSIALHTAFSLLIASFALLLIHSDEGFMKEISSDSFGGVFARRLLPAVVFVPTIIGWICLRGQNMGFYGAEFGLALFTVSNIFIFSILIWWSAQGLNHADLERKRADQVVKLNSQRLEILHKIDSSIISSRSIQAVADMAVYHIREIIPCQQAGLVLFEQASNELIFFAVDLDRSSALGIGTRYPIPSGFLSEFSATTVTVIDDIQLLLDPSPTYQQLIKEGMRASLRALLVYDDQPVGVLALTADTPNFFTIDHQQITKEIATQLAIAIKQMQLSEELALHTELIEDTRSFLQATLDAFPANTAVLDSDGTIITINKPWENFASENNANSTAYLGMNYLEICDTADASEDASSAASGIRAVIAGKQNDFHMEYICDSPDEERWFMLRVTPFKEAVPRRVVVSHIDITERTHAELAIKRYAHRVEVLHQIDKNIIQGMSIDKLVEEVLKDIRQLIPCQRASIGLFDYDNNEWLVFALDTDTNSILGKGTRFPIAPDTATRIDQAIEVIDDLRIIADPIPAYVQFIKTGLVSALHAHLLGEQQQLGSLNLFADTPAFFNEEYQEIALEIANQLTIVINQMKLSEEIARHTELLETRVAERTAKLNDAKDRVEAILNNSADGILLADFDLIIQQTNPSFDSLFDCAPDDYFGKPLVTLFQSQDTEQVAKLISDLVTEHERHHIEASAITKDGIIFDAELSIRHIKGDGFVCNIRDITQRKEQERQLHYHANLQENVSDAVIVTDMQFRIQSWNKAAERVYGWRAEEVVNRVNVEILRSEFDTEVHKNNTQDLSEKEWWQGEIIQHHKDGSIRYIQESATVVKDKQGVPFSIVFVDRDISDHKAAIDAIEKSAAEIHDLYNNAPCGYHSIDKNGTFVQINDTELMWLGYERDEVINKLKITDIFTPESLLVFQENFPILKEVGYVNGLELELFRKDGSTLNILVNAVVIYDEDGQYSHSRSSVFDINELKTARQALINNEASYRLLIENITDVIIKMNPDGAITFITPSCYVQMGYSVTELLGKSKSDIIHPDDYQTVHSTRLQAVDSGMDSYSFIARILHKAGHEIWIEATSTIIRDSEGYLVEIIMVIRDITVRKLAQDALTAKVLEEQAFQKHLKILHEISIELTQISDLDSFYRVAVESGIKRLGFERMALFRYDEEDSTALGTYGTDSTGAVINEQHIRFTPDPNGIMLQAFNKVERFYFGENVPLHEDQQMVGTGWNASAVLWNGSSGLGWLVVDNLLSHSPASKGLLDILGLYALSIGTLLAQKDIQIALRESEERFRLLLDSAPVATVITDQIGRITFVNDRAEGLFSYDRSELMGQMIEMLVPDYANNRDIHNYDTYKEGPRLGQMGLGSELFARRKDSSEFPVEIELSYIKIRNEIRVMSFIIDITERKRTAAELERQRTFLRQIIDVTPSMIFVKDYNSRFILVNPTVAKLYNTKVENLIGKTDGDLRSISEESEAFSEADRQVIDSGEPLYLEESITNESGETRWLQTTKVPISSADGQAIHVLGVSTDITEHKQSEEMLRLAFEKEKELGELKSRFVSMASHEFRTPLATIFALTETLTAYRHKLPDDQIDYRLAKIQEQVEHLKDIMEDVLLLARMQARRVDFNPVKVNLDSLTRSVLDEFQSRPDIEHEFVYSCDDRLKEITLDKKLMRQITNNLVSNAIKYSSPNAKIVISLSIENSDLIFKVQDGGIGIPEADLKHLFEPFHRATNVGTISGTGLGLVITKELVELHSGVISVDSTIGVGTTFTVSIPLYQEGGVSNHDENSSN